MRASAAIILRVAQAEAHAPAGHVVALRHREDLDGHFLGAIHLQNAGGFVAVEAQVGVGEIVHHHGAVLRAPAGRSRVKKSRSTQCVVGLCGKEIRISFGFSADGAVEILQAVQELRGVGHGQHAGMPLGHDDAVLVDGVGRVGRDHGVARADDREQQMRQRILGADGDDGFLVRIEIHAVVGLVALDDLLAAASECRATSNSGDCGRCVPLRSAFSRPGRGVAPSGLPIPRSTTSSCAARNWAFISLTTANT